MNARRHLLRALPALGLLPWLAACELPPPPLRVGSIVFPGYELLFLARELGLLDEQRVRLIEMRSNTDTLRALGAGQLEAAALTLDELLSARADGLDLRVVAVLDVSAGADVVLGKRAVARLADLAGARVGVEDAAGGGLMLSAFLQAAGLRIDQIRKKTVSLDRSIEAWLRDDVDVLVTAEPWAGQIEALGARRLFDSNAIPGRIVDVLAVHAHALPAQGVALRQLLAGQFTALSRWQQQASELAPRLAGRLQMPPHQVPGAFRGLQLPDAAQNHRLLGGDGGLLESARSLGAMMLGQGLLRTAPPLDTLIDARFLPGAA